jgi:HEAT repeat protein
MRGIAGCVLVWTASFPTAYSHSIQTDVESLVKSLKSKDADVRLEAVKIIGKSRKAINLALPELTQAAKDPDGFVRSEAVRALGKSGGQVSKVMPVLIQALSLLSS